MKLVAEHESVPAERTLCGLDREAYDVLRRARKHVLEIELSRHENPTAVKRAFRTAAKACNRRITFQTDATKSTLIFVQWSNAESSVKLAGAPTPAKLKYDWSDADVEKAAAALGYDLSRELTDSQLRTARKRITDFYKRGDLEAAFKPNVVPPKAKT